MEVEYLDTHGVHGIVYGSRALGESRSWFNCIISHRFERLIDIFGNG